MTGVVRTGGSTGQNGSSMARPGLVGREPTTDRGASAMKVTVFQIVDEIKHIGRGWNESVSSTLSIPGQAYRRGDGNYIIFSKNENELDAVGEAVNALKNGRAVNGQLPEYGLVVYETASQNYLVLIDRRREVVVHTLLSSLHETEVEGWTNVKDIITRQLDMNR